MRFSNIFVSLTELFNDYWFINGRIEEKGGIYSFLSTCTEKIIGFEEYHIGRHFSEGEMARFALRLDGDFLEVFVDGTMLLTLVKFDRLGFFWLP